MPTCFHCHCWWASRTGNLQVALHRIGLKVASACCSQLYTSYNLASMQMRGFA